MSEPEKRIYEIADEKKKLETGQTQITEKRLERERVNYQDVVKLIILICVDRSLVTKL